MDLYVSDLDGTLLNSNAHLSDTTIAILNNLIARGLNFSLATARSIDTAAKIIAPLNLRLPIVVNNGVFVYDPIKMVNILSNYLNKDDARYIINVFESMNISPIIHTKEKHFESKAYYCGIFNFGEAFYINDRLASGDKRFVLVKDISTSLNDDIITIIAIGDNEKLEPAYREINSALDVACHYTVDIYSKATWLEITHKKANKRDAVKFVKDLLNAGKLICFGDNLNDISMFEIADEKCAVSNAHDLLKKMATSVILSNNEDGVARYIEKKYHVNIA